MLFLPSVSLGTTAKIRMSASAAERRPYFSEVKLGCYGVSGKLHVCCNNEAQWREKKKGTANMI